MRRLLEFLQEVTVMIISVWAFNLVEDEGIDYRVKWTDGTVLFNMFPQHLAGPLDQQWWDLTSANAANQDAVTFHSIVNAFVL